ncbi:MAG: hypothetical protein D4R39_04225 [Methylophilaceae bacterium]|nr:MAG: hypothetical protein D4R39_04225 [Methylophilaceae bacterium]
MTKRKPAKPTALKPVAPKVTPAQASKPAVTATIAVKPAINKAVIAKPATSKAVVSVTKTAVKKVAATQPVKIVKAPKVKMERDSFTMPKAEYAQFHVLKERLQKLGSPVKKSELLRAGIMQLSAMTDAALSAVMSKVPTIKTGRPKK